MIAQTVAKLHTHSKYVQCIDCGVHQTRDFQNPCMYCGGSRFRRVYEKLRGVSREVKK